MNKKYYDPYGSSMNYYYGYAPLRACPQCGHMPLPGASVIDWRLPPNFYPWLGQCPKCDHELWISAYNVDETCDECGFTGMRDRYKNDTHMPNVG